MPRSPCAKIWPSSRRSGKPCAGTSTQWTSNPLGSSACSSGCRVDPRIGGITLFFLLTIKGNSLLIDVHATVASPLPDSPWVAAVRTGCRRGCFFQRLARVARVLRGPNGLFCATQWSCNSALLVERQDIEAIKAQTLLWANAQQPFVTNQVPASCCRTREFKKIVHKLTFTKSAKGIRFVNAIT